MNIKLARFLSVPFACLMFFTHQFQFISGKNLPSSYANKNAIVRKVITSSKVAAPISPLSHAILVGNQLWISGQLGVDRNGTLQNGIQAQTRQALDNIGYILEEAGANFLNVVKTTVLLADIGDLTTVNTIYQDEYFTKDFPARITYEPKSMVLSALMEIDAWAILGDIEAGGSDENY